MQSTLKLLKEEYGRRKAGQHRGASEAWLSRVSVVCCYTVQLLQALQGLIQGARQAYQPYFDDPVQQRLWRCLYHPNRFIRETGYEICGDLCSIFAGQPLESWGKDLAVKLQDGLSENWSQVGGTWF